MYTRHKFRSPRERSIVLLYQRARLGVQRAVRVRLDQQTADGHEHISQGQPAVPIALQRLHAHPTALGIDVGVEDAGPEVSRRRLLWIFGWNRQVKLPYSGGEWSVRWPGEEDVELAEVVGVG